jgi:hypothetical protein
MSLSRRNPRRDLAEPEVMETLKAYGWTVKQVSARDFGDLVIAKGARTVVVEVKTGKKQLRPGQQRFMQTWPGEKAILRSAEDVRTWHTTR